MRTELLKRGSVQSCGCLLDEVRGKICIKQNRYKEEEDFYIGYTSRGTSFLIDKDDFDKVKEYSWSVSNQGYIVARLREGRNSKTILMHRFIMGAEGREVVVDHINHNTTDNRKSNLRICSQGQNTMNSHMLKNNTSGVKGVRFSKDKNKWNAYITFNKKQIHLGYFDLKDEAIAARKKAEEKYFKEFNFSDNNSYVLALDVGSTQSGYCITDMKTLKPIRFGKVDNENVYKEMEYLKELYGEHHIAIEQFAFYGSSNPIGSTTIDAITWNGKYIRQAELYGIDYEFVFRREEKMLLVGNMKCGDKEIRQALISKFASTSNGKGTKEKPDFFYKFSADSWTAYAISLVYIMRKKGVTKAKDWM